MSGPFAKRHGCRISVICHCLPRPGRDGLKFFQCCGWYHKACEGRFNDKLPRTQRTEEGSK